MKKRAMREPKGAVVYELEVTVVYRGEDVYTAIAGLTAASVANHGKVGGIKGLPLLHVKRSTVQRLRPSATCSKDAPTIRYRPSIFFALRFLQYLALFQGKSLTSKPTFHTSKISFGLKEL